MEELIDECLRICEGVKTVRFLRKQPPVASTFYVCCYTAKIMSEQVLLDEDKMCIAVVSASDNSKYKIMPDLEKLAKAQDPSTFREVWLKQTTTRELKNWQHKLRVLGTTAEEWRCSLSTAVTQLPLFKSMVTTKRASADGGLPNKETSSKKQKNPPAKIQRAAPKKVKHSPKPKETRNSDIESESESECDEGAPRNNDTIVEAQPEDDESVLTERQQEELDQKERERLYSSIEKLGCIVKEEHRAMSLRTLRYLHMELLCAQPSTSVQSEETCQPGFSQFVGRYSDKVSI